MKKRRTLIISLLLVAALTLGIGYAVQTGTVELNGEVSNKPHPVKLVFVEDGSRIYDSKVTGEGGTQIASTNNELVVVDGAHTATLDIFDLSHENDYITAYLRIKNTNNYQVALDADPDKAANLIISNKDGTLANGEQQFFSVTAEWIKQDTDVEAGTLTLSKDQTKTLQVTIKMTKATANTLEGRYVLTVTGTSAQ
jgi:hypothetical protein